MKNLLVKAFCVLLSLCLLLCALPGAALAEYVVPINGQTYIRSQPSLIGNVVGQLVDGDYAVYLEQTWSSADRMTWYKIRCNGVTGWVCSKYATLSASAGDSGESVYADGDAYIRDYPAVYGHILAKLPEGARAEYLGQRCTDDLNVDWYYVSYGSATGWVSSKSTSLGFGGFDTGDHGDDPGFNPYGDGWGDFGEIYAVGGDSYLRKRPGDSGAQITLFPEGATASYLGRSSEDERGLTWYQVSYRSKTGWVSAKFAAFPGPSDRYSKYVVASSGATYIRSSASTDARELGGLPKGATANYLGETRLDMNGREWYKLRYQGITGWVSARYTELQ